MIDEQYKKRIEQNHKDLLGVLQHYPVEPGKITLLPSRGGRSKWLIETDKGNMFLRLETINPKRMLFIAGAHWYLQQKGFPIAKLIPTRNGGLCLSGGNHIYLMTEANEGKGVQYYEREEIMKTMGFIGAFHKASVGYSPVKGSKRRTRIGKWKKLYQWKIQELESNMKLAMAADANDTFSQLFIEHADQMLKRGKEALKELDQPAFSDWTRETMESGMFCQQDFTMARMIMKDNQVFMKDLHSITIDLPARDLRILMNKVMKKLSVWDRDLAYDMLQAYDQVFPLKKEYYQVLLTDLKFPHLFCGLAHKYYLEQKKSWGDEKYLMYLRNIIAVEQSKQAFLTDFDQLISRVKGGVS